MNRHYPTIKNTFWLLGFNFLLTIGFYGLLNVIAVVTKAVPTDQIGTLMNKYPLWLGVSNMLTIGLTVVWGFKKTKTDFRSVFPLRPVSPLIFIPIILTVAGLSILISDIDNLLRNLLHWRIEADDFFVALYRQPVWIQIFILMIVAPFTEEFLFRGLIFTGYLNNYSFKRSIWISAVWFALFHLNVMQFPVAFCSGLLLAWLVGRTNSLWPALFAHAVMNGMPLFFAKTLQVQIIGYTYQTGSQMAFQPLWFDILGLFLVLTGVGLFGMLKAQTQKPMELMRPQLLEELEDRNDGNPPARFNAHGRVSLLIGILTFVMLVSALCLAKGIVRHGPNMVQQMITGLIALCGFLGSLIGTGIAIVGLIKKQGRIASWTGLALNGVYLLFALSVAIIMMTR